MDGFGVKPEAYTFDFVEGADSGFHVNPEAYAFELTIGDSSATTRDGFHVKPEAYAIITSAENGFHVKPEAYAIIPPDTSDKEGFHVNPRAYAFEFLVGADNGFHVNPEAYAFEFLIGADNGFHVKPEAYAFELVLGRKQLVLRLAIRHNGENVLVPFTTTVSSPAVVIRWNGLNWYNPLVPPTNYNASIIRTRYDGKTLALSKD